MKSAVARNSKEHLKKLGFKNAYEYLQYIVSTIKPDFDACVVWEFCKSKDGYGIVYSYGKSFRAHRLALELKLGRMLGRDEEACHKCDNRGCINPNHLFPGSKKDNMLDMGMKGRTGRFERIPQYRRNAIRDMYVLGWNKSVIAESVGVDRSTVTTLVRDIDIDAIAALQRSLEANDTNSDIVSPS